jgi:hypothetical protein
MSNRTPTPQLVMGYIEVMTLDGEEGIPYDEAVIHFERDEDDSEINVHCPNASKIAESIVKAVNSHDALVKALTDILDANNEPYLIARKALASIKERT